jgi:ferric enterobactin receptor
VLNGSTYVRRTGNAIETVRFVDENGVQNQTFRNIGRNATYGASLFGSFKPVPLWELSGNLNFYYVSLSSPASDITASALRNSGLMYNVNINSSYKFAKAGDDTATPWRRGLSVQFYGGLNSPRIQLQGRQAAWTFYSVGLRKNLLKDKADLTLNADNFLQATRNLNTVLETPQFTQESNNYIYLRGVRLAFNYRFGNVSAQPQKRRKGIQNDDTKQGEGGNGQQ